jgi:hypothetical protein
MVDRYCIDCFFVLQWYYYWEGSAGESEVKSMGIFSFEALKVTQLLLDLIYLYYANVISVPLLSPLSLK